jgi:hypothetical protein
MAVTGYENQAAALKSVRKFETAQGRIDKAFCRLNEAVEHVNHSFAPVLEGERPQGVDNSKEPVPPQSEFERLVASVEARAYSIAQSLDYICERSSV